MCKKVYEEIWEERRKKIWNEEMRQEYKKKYVGVASVDKNKHNFECVCKICGTTFTAGSATAAYCSDECKDIKVEMIKKERRDERRRSRENDT